MPVAPENRALLHTAALPAAGAKFVRVWSLSEGFPCQAALQVADLRGSVKAIAATGGMLYVGGQSCQVTAYKLSSNLLDGSYSPTVSATGQVDGTTAGGAGNASRGAASAPTPVVPPSPPNNLNGAGRICGGVSQLRKGSATDGTVQACGGSSQETIRAMVGGAQTPDAASDPQHSHCGSITALAACGPYVFSASTGGLPAVRALWLCLLTRLPSRPARACPSMNLSQACSAGLLGPQVAPFRHQLRRSCQPLGISLPPALSQTAPCACGGLAAWSLSGRSGATVAACWRCTAGRASC